MSRLDEATKKTLWTEYANEWTRLHPEDVILLHFISKKVYKDSFKDKLVKFIIERRNGLQMLHDEFERLIGG